MSLVPCNRRDPLEKSNVPPGMGPIEVEGLKDIGVHGIRPTRRVKDDLSGIVYDDTRLNHGKMNPSDSDFREILHLILEEMKEFGRRGFCVRVGCVLYAIVGFRADLVAMNALQDSSGRHSSNVPCSRCLLHVRTFDPWLQQLVESAALSCYKNRSKFRSYNSVVVTLSSDDLLRLVPLFMWMRNSLSDGDVLMKRILSEILKKGSETPGDVADVGSVQVEERIRLFLSVEVEEREEFQRDFELKKRKILMCGEKMMMIGWKYLLFNDLLIVILLVLLPLRFLLLSSLLLL